jgi:hypothetical protein
VVNRGTGKGACKRLQILGRRQGPNPQALTIVPRLSSRSIERRRPANRVTQQFVMSSIRAGENR